MTGRVGDIPSDPMAWVPELDEDTGVLDPYELTFLTDMCRSGQLDPLEIDCRSWPPPRNT